MLCGRNKKFLSINLVTRNKDNYLMLSRLNINRIQSRHFNVTICFIGLCLHSLDIILSTVNNHHNRLFV